MSTDPDADTRPHDAPSLDELVAQCLDRMEKEGHGALEQMCAQHPSLSDGLRARIRALEAAGLLDEDGDELEGAAPASIPERLGEFRLLERLGQGGMGVVFLAEQESLGRRVALKLIRPEQLWFKGARARFRREVEAVARLAHPGIVPVHTVGEEQGIPFYAMEFVGGCSLAEALRELRGADPAKLSGADLAEVVQRRAGAAAESSSSGESRLFAGTWTQCALRLVRRVAEALDHAHQRGVLHRDVKPSNLMLTPEGRVLLLDFGLAAMQGTSRLTRSGAQLGSLPYMAPEQVAGERDAISTRTDVYALGVTLYELLTLRLPYFGDNEAETMQAILDADPQAPRRVNEAVPWDVEVVCLTAMAREPARRYASAADFARDLDALLELRPIAARPPGPLMRLRRLVQRRPALSVAIALVGLGVTVGPLIYADQQRRARNALAAANAKTEQANRDLGLALAEAERARARSDRNFDRAVAAVDTMLTRVGAQRLVDVPQMEGVRRELLEEALLFYEQLVEDAGEADDEKMRLELGRASGRAGEILLKLGRHADAEQSYRRQFAIAEELRARGVGAEADDRILALSGLANTIHQQNRYADAVPVYQRMLEILEETPEVERDEAHRRHELAGRFSLASTLKHLDRAAEGIALLERCVELERAAIAEAPESNRDRYSLALSLSEIGRIALMEGDDELARTRLREALKEVEFLLDAEPDKPDYGALTVNTALELSRAESLGGDDDGAIALLRRARDLAAPLCRDYPLVPLYRNLRAAANMELARLLWNRGEQQEADASFDDAIATLEALRAEHPENSSYEYNIGECFQGRANVQRAHGNLEGAALSFERAEQSMVRALEQMPGFAFFHGATAQVRRDRQDLLLEKGDVAAAAERALAVPEELENHAPSWLDSARTLRRCADAFPESAGEWRAAAEECLEKARAAGATPDEIAATAGEGGATAEDG